MTRCLDHVVPQVRAGGTGYRNLVSVCGECNGQKGVQPADEYLRWLYREACLSRGDLKGRLRALEALAVGKLRPVFGSQHHEERAGKMSALPNEIACP